MAGWPGALRSAQLPGCFAAAVAPACVAGVGRCPHRRPIKTRRVAPMTQRGRAGAGRGRLPVDPAAPPGDRPRRPAPRRPPASTWPPRAARLRDVVEPVVVAAGYDLEESDALPGRPPARGAGDGRRRRRHQPRRRRGGLPGGLRRARRGRGGRRRAARPASTSSRSARPGVDRPLTLPRHWRRNVGRLVDGDRRRHAR